jgi:hypothetical protein
MARVCLGFALYLASVMALAGGTSVPVQYLELKSTGPDRYLLTFKTLATDDYEGVLLPRNAKVSVRLRFNREWYATAKPDLSVDKYRNAIAILERLTASQTHGDFGLLAGGVCPVAKSKSVFESDALEVVEEVSPGRAPTKMVYSLCKWR